MSKGTYEYQPVQTEEFKGHGYSERALDDDVITSLGNWRPLSWKPSACLIALAVSILVNALQLLTNIYLYHSLSSMSSFANLEFDKSIPWVHDTKYSDANVSKASSLWRAIDSDIGVVALPKAYAAQKGLPNAQPFPWDNTRSIYFLNGFHSLHCLKSIHQSITEFTLNQQQSYPLGHITHCLDTLRVETLCQADDTPRYTSPSRTPTSGVGQPRQCRDWNQLEAWAREHHACYRRISQAAGDGNHFERFKFCPLDSPYRPVAEAYFEKFVGHSLDEGIGW